MKQNCHNGTQLHDLTTMRRYALISALLLGVACDEGDVITGFVPGPQPASQLTMLVQPSNVTVLEAISPPVRVEIRNNAGQIVANSTLPVTMSLTPNTGTPGATAAYRARRKG